jgi:predicted PurR-regulated permease PerM
MPDAFSESIFTRKVLITVGLVCLTLLFLLLLFFAFDVLMLVFAAALMAVFLRGLADFLRRYVNISEGFAVLIVSALLLGLLSGGIALLAPDVAEQMAHLRRELPRSAAAAAEYISRFGWGRAIIEQLPSVDDVRSGLDPSLLLSGVRGFFTSTIGAIGNFFIVILLGIYFAAEPRLYTRGFTSLFPLDRRTRVREILVAINDTLRWWLIGKIASMLFIGVVTWIGLSIIGVPLALALGLIAGLLSFIPNFGPIISAVPALLLAFIASPTLALYTLGLYVGVQLIESNLVTPIIERETVEIPPALTIVFQLTLAVLVGGLGLVLATPLLAVIIVLVKMVHVEDILGDRPNLVITEEKLSLEAEELRIKEEEDAADREAKIT